MKATCSDHFRRILLAWCWAVLFEFSFLPSSRQALETTEVLSSLCLWRVGLLTCAVWLCVSFAACFVNFRQQERFGIAVGFGVLALSALITTFTWAFMVACLFCLGGCILFGVRGWNGSTPLSPAPLPTHKVWGWLTVVLAALFFLFVCAWGLGRYATFSTPTYDFGIFSQMFYHMGKSGVPLTTLERSGLLSHFSVHVSPIFYLLLPFYLIFDHPALLQVLQAAVLTSAVFPLWLLGKHHGLSGAQRMLVCTLLLVFPAFSGGSGYDIHENCFLVPLIFWLFYGLDCGKLELTVTAAILTLSVKEDAAVYVAVIALFHLLKTILHPSPDRRKQILTALGLFAAAGLWFVAATYYLSTSGDGVMRYRYDNLMPNGTNSLLAVVKTVICHPMKALFECVDADKLRYIAQTMFPILGLPLLTRRFERYILLIPYLLFNLMTDYPYQHNIFFQYSFGSLACLFYLTVINLADFRKKAFHFSILLAAVAVSATLFGILVVPKAMHYPFTAISNRTHYDNIRATLARIPADVPVAASTFYTAALSQRDILYDLDYCTNAQLEECSYVVIGAYQSDSDRIIEVLTQQEYSIFVEYSGVLIIYQSPTP